MTDQPEAQTPRAPADAERSPVVLGAAPRFGGRFAGFGPGAAAATAAVLVSAAATGFSVWHLVALGAGLAAAGLMSGREALDRAPLIGGDRAGIGMISARDLLAEVAAPVAVVDPKGVVIAANPAMRRLAPLVEPGRPLYGAIRQPDILAAVEKAAAGAVAGTVAFAESTPPPRAFDVEIFAVRAAASTRTAPDAVVLWFHDQTQMRRVEEMRSDFVANVSHELRTPLASVLGFIETLQGPAREDRPARERFLAIMAEQARRMARLIDDLLSLSRIELRQHLRPTGAEALEPLIGHVADTLRQLAEDRSVAIRIAPSPANHVVTGDRDELIRVFENLLENAIKYGTGGGGGAVDIDVTDEPALGQKPAMAVVSVRDHGPGIAPEHLPRLTERFYRVDVAESRGKGGTGLGLAIVKHVIARHGGRLAIESTPGEGAVFRVYLPLFHILAAPPPAVTELSSP